MPTRIMPTKIIQTKFFHYHQNNSGGSFSSPAINVVVEAISAKDADSRAENIGLYFDGEGDCGCCGDRWSTQYGKGEEVPSIYGEPLTNNPTVIFDWSTKKIPHDIVYYINGTKKVYKTKGN